MFLDLLDLCLTPAIDWKILEGRSHYFPNGETPIIPKSDARNMAADWPAWSIYIAFRLKKILFQKNWWQDNRYTFIT